MAVIAIIGAGPAGLMAAESLASCGNAVTVYDRKPTPGRKFLMAGRGGLNLTHSENLSVFLTRYGAASERLSPIIESFPPSALCAWCEELGQKVFTGSSGRIFPESLKASPLLRAWTARLDRLGVKFIFNAEWLGWSGNNLRIRHDNGEDQNLQADAVLLALGGASWPRLGSDGSWVEILRENNVAVMNLRPANCGFVIPWSDIFRERFAGHPVKPVTLQFNGQSVQGEMMITARGIEGGAVYALSAALRDAIERDGQATLYADLRPGLAEPELAKRLSAPRGRQSFSTWLQKAGGLNPVTVNLLRESDSKITELPPPLLARRIKAVELVLTAPFPLDRAISTAGGVSFDDINADFMLKNRPGVFIAGEMLDWEAPTGGYLLQATFSTAVAAAKGMLRWLDSQQG